MCKGDLGLAVECDAACGMQGDGVPDELDAMFVGPVLLGCEEGTRCVCAVDFESSFFADELFGCGEVGVPGHVVEEVRYGEDFFVDGEERGAGDLLGL